MASLKDAAERQAFSLAIDATLKSLNKDREKGLLNIVNLAQKFMGSNFRSEAYEGAKKMIQNPDSKWMRYVNRLLDETDPHVAKMTALNLGYQAAFAGTKKIRKMREIENCNIPWLILMDPTSACNLHCTGCWAAEYGHKLNLTFDELDNIVTQGKELGVYFYMMTGGEPLVRKADIIRLCEKHNDCAFHCYTNGTLVDEKLCEDMKRVGNLSLSISLEGFEDANDFRRGEGVYNKVLHAMDLLHENGLIFGNSVCYTSKNMDAVTSDEFFDLLIEHGSRFAWYFHLMPVGMKASPELMPTKEQREYIYHRLREVRGFEGGKEIFVMIQSLNQQEPTIVSCGGGVAMRQENVDCMRDGGSVVFLTATPQTIYERVKNSTDRPLLNGHMNVAYISELMEVRRPKYEAAADILVATDGKTKEEIAEEIIGRLEE